MGKKLEFFYDCSSPWTYLAFSQIEEVAQRGGTDVIWRPILVGGVFNTVNPSVYESRANPVKVKARYYKKDMQDWAHLYGLKITDPGNLVVFPVNSVKAMRGAFVAQEHGKISPYSRRVFETYWGENRDISKDDVLRDIVRGVGLDETEYFTQNRDAAVQGQAQGQYRRADRARRFRLADDFRRRRHVLRQRSLDAGGARPRASALRWS